MSDGVSTDRGIGGRRDPAGWSPRCCVRWRAPRSTTSRTCCGPATSSPAPVDHRRPGGVGRTTGSWRSSCCGTPERRRRLACCPAARTREPPSFMGHKGERVLTVRPTITGAAVAAGSSTPTRSATCATRRWHRSTCTRRRTPARTCRRRSRSTRSRGTSTSCSSSPRGAGRPTRPFSIRRRRRCSTRRRSPSFVEAKLKTIGTSACPPYHLALVVGEAPRPSSRSRPSSWRPRSYLDRLPTSGNDHGRRSATSIMERAGLRDRTADRRRGAVRREVLRPRRARHPSAAPRRLVPGRPRRVVLGRPAGARAKITREGVFLEQLEENPARYPAGRGRRGAAERRRSG